MTWLVGFGVCVGVASDAIAADHGHRHATSAANHRIGFDTPATREFESAHARMMRNMAKPFTGDADVDFRTHMIPHHQGAIDMSWIALRYANDPWTRQAAQVILIEQQQEVAQFQSELMRHGAKAPPGGQPYYIIDANTYPDADMTRAEDAPGSREELVGKTWGPGSGVPQQLRRTDPAKDARSRDRASTREFKAAHARMMQNMHKPFTGDPDVDFLTHMIPHHQGAIDMARVALRYATNAWTRQSAAAIITAQEREIFHFQAWLARHGKSSK